MNFEIVSEEEVFENVIFSEIESQEENDEMDGKFLLFLSNESSSQVKRTFIKAETTACSLQVSDDKIFWVGSIMSKSEMSNNETSSLKMSST